MGPRGDTQQQDPGKRSHVACLEKMSGGSSVRGSPLAALTLTSQEQHGEGQCHAVSEWAVATHTTLTCPLSRKEGRPARGGGRLCPQAAGATPVLPALLGGRWVPTALCAHLLLVLQVGVMPAYRSTAREEPTSALPPVLLHLLLQPLWLRPQPARCLPQGAPKSGRSTEYLMQT